MWHLTKIILMWIGAISIVGLIALSGSNITIVPAKPQSPLWYQR